MFTQILTLKTLLLQTNLSFIASALQTAEHFPQMIHSEFVIRPLPFFI